MIPVYVSNGTFITRYNGRDFRLYSKYAPLLHADGFEFLMYGIWKDEVREVRSYLRSLKLEFPVMHLDKEIGEILAEHGYAGREEALRIFERDIWTAQDIGAKKAVLHLWNGPFSDSRFDEVVCLYADMHDAAQRRGIELVTENVTCKQNLALDHMLKIRSLCPDAKFTFDTKMAFLHDENALLESEKYIKLLTEKAITHLHVNDSKYAPGSSRSPIMHIGDGIIDFGRFFYLLKKTGFDGTATVESTSVIEDGSVLVDKLNDSLDIVRKRLNA